MMRFFGEDSAREGECTASAASSVQSGDSFNFEIYGSACSDFTDCEYCDEERRKHKTRNSINTEPNHSTNHSVCSTMSLLEAAPLLQNAARIKTYKSIRADSYDSLGPAELSANAILATYNRTKKFDKSMKADRRKQNSFITIFSVWNTIMGSSLLTMAWGVERAGLPAALILVAFMAAICLYTAYILLRVNLHHGGENCEVPALCRSLLGRGAEVVAHTFSLLVLLGANIVYWVLITNFLYFTVNYFVEINSSNTTEYNTTVLCPHQLNLTLVVPEATYESPYWGLHTTVPIYVAFIVFPLLNFRNVSFFTKFNSLGTLSAIYLIGFVLVKGYSWGINFSPPETPGGLQNAAVLSGMLALSFYIHNIIITIMSNNARQDKNDPKFIAQELKKRISMNSIILVLFQSILKGRDLTIAFLLVTITYTIVGGVFYICFPLAKSCIEDNLLNNFDIHDVMTAVARVLLLFQVVTVYPLVAYMLRSEAILLSPWKETRGLTILINVCIVILCILVACFCPSIGTIIRYTGAVSGLVHIFALPSLLQMRSLKIRGRLTWYKTTFYCLIILFGVLNLLMQFFITE